MGIGPNKAYSYSSVAIIGFLPLASFLIFGAQWSHLALFCQNPVFLLSDGRIPDSHAFWVMTSRTFSFLGGGLGLSGRVLPLFCFLYGFRTCRVGHLECACLMSHISNFWSKFSKTSATPTAGRYISKNDVRCAKTRYCALKTCFMHIIGFNAMKALGMVQMRCIMQN